MYFPFSELQYGGKRSALQPPTIYSEFPQCRAAIGKRRLILNSN